MYLPAPTNETIQFPLPRAKDYALQIRMIEQKWMRFYPLITYYPILKATTVNTDPTGASLIGTEGSTIFDPIYGESIDPTLLTVGWEQPHGSVTYHTAEVDVFADPVQVNARILVAATDVELHKFGFDRQLDLIIIIPASILDSVSVTMQAGDKFRWGEGDGNRGGEYTIIELSENKRYLNTATMLYVAGNCKSRRKGS